MTFKHRGFNKKRVSIILIFVTVLLITGGVVYNGILEEKAAKEVSSFETPRETESDRPEVDEPLTEPVTAQAQPQSILESREISLPFNELVLAQIETYNKGSYPYLLNNDYANYNGVTSNLYYQGKLLLKAHPSGNRANHCVGITFEVFFHAMQKWNQQQGYAEDSIKGLTYEQLYDFILNWYVAGPKAENNLVIALEKYHLGKRITNFEEARPGDFIDFSRENQTGHTVILIDWIRENHKIVGLKYWSSQESTNGIDYKTEYFNIFRSDGTKYGNIMTDSVYIGRVVP